MSAHQIKIEPKYRIKESINGVFYPQYRYKKFFGGYEWRSFEKVSVFNDDSIYFYSLIEAKEFISKQIKKSRPPVYHDYP